MCVPQPLSLVAFNAFKYLNHLKKNVLRPIEVHEEKIIKLFPASVRQVTCARRKCKSFCDMWDGVLVDKVTGQQLLRKVAIK